jgi:hypothetical protein
VLTSSFFCCNSRLALGAGGPAGAVCLRVPVGMPASYGTVRYCSAMASGRGDKQTGRDECIMHSMLFIAFLRERSGILLSCHPEWYFSRE